MGEIVVLLPRMSPKYFTTDMAGALLGIAPVGWSLPLVAACAHQPSLVHKTAVRTRRAATSTAFRATVWAWLMFLLLLYDYFLSKMMELDQTEKV